MAEHWTEEFWDNRYREHPDRLWSGRPNQRLVEEVSKLTPGRALEIGAGEGADAIWLAARGWAVTAVDISGVALERAAQHAAAAGPEVAARVTWLRQDFLTWQPPVASFDLVTSQYTHLPPGERDFLLDGLAAAVAIGGTLLVVGHHPSDLESRMPRPHHPELFFTGADIAARLDAERWQVVTDYAAPRIATTPDGEEVSIHDTVFRATRLS